MVLLIDNYDSFTYNLYDYILQSGEGCRVIRNDEVKLEEIGASSFDSAVISPGPKTPKDAGITMGFINQFYRTKPILGICLGHQAIGEFFGARLVKASKPMHGKASLVTHTNHSLFTGLENPIEVMRYHSLILEELEQTNLQTIAKTALGEVMAVAHSTLPIVGVQFHPESILTPNGLQLIQNWFSIIANF